ncbi:MULTISPECIES: phosphatase PAP2 family protein [Sphingobacterium]|uniref:phosphatase PAP2 family protein n=1 Tax=Sphingobacterium TaxID=28453 RepID=UPI0013DC70C1|nr:MULTISPECIES: phosphatase PAP2 family protein [unclassified Sphingobacterium]
MANLNRPQTVFLLFIWLLLPIVLKAQSATVSATDTIKTAKSPKKKYYKQLIVPSVLIGYGIVGLESPYLIGKNNEIRNEFQENIDEKIAIDDFSQYAGTASVFALDALGIKAKHNLKQRLFRAALSNAIMATTVITIKSTSTVWRPDSSANNSFPSGHTATAFVGAELLWQEYRHQSIWYGIAGYAVATGTGFFRMYNNKHWFSDVAMGAGIGILSTKISYWVLPLFEDRIKKKKNTYLFLPGYDGKKITLHASLRF